MGTSMNICGQFVDGRHIYGSHQTTQRTLSRVSVHILKKGEVCGIFLILRVYVCSRLSEVPCENPSIYQKCWLISGRRLHHLASGIWLLCPISANVTVLAASDWPTLLVLLSLHFRSQIITKVHGTHFFVYVCSKTTHEQFIQRKPLDNVTPMLKTKLLLQPSICEHTHTTIRIWMQISVPQKLPCEFASMQLSTYQTSGMVSSLKIWVRYFYLLDQFWGLVSLFDGI